MRNKKLFSLLSKEIRRQNETVDLIPSENIVSADILQLLGSVLTNKYSEGYPGKRYYPGNRFIDEIETLCQASALKLFKLSPKTWSVNVQPYSGSPANLAVYLALVGTRGKLLGFELQSGGHLTMGHSASFTGKLFRVKQYAINPTTHLLDYRKIERIAKHFKPKLIVSGLTSYSRKIDFKKFGYIAKKVGAYHLADISHIAGLVAAGLHQSPFPYADVVTSTTHKTLRGPRGALIFSRKNVKLKMKNEKLTIAEAIDKAVFPGLQGGPHENAIAAIAQALYEARMPHFKQYQRHIIKNAKILSKALMAYGFKLLTNGTDNHLMVIDLKNINLSGSKAQDLLEKAGILANRNAILGDKSPFNPSGLRLGTPAVTSRGMKEKEMKQIALLIKLVLIDKVRPSKIKKEVIKLCSKFPLPYK